MIEPLRFVDGALELLDQRRLPAEETWIRCRTAEDVAEAIRAMVVRGAPAIGVAAAYGMALAARGAAAQPPDRFREAIRGAAAALEKARPTAVNLSWAVRRLLESGEAALDEAVPPEEAAARMERLARRLHDEDVEANRAIGRHGSILVPEGARILTHCNAGALATAGYGTALGVVRAAVEEGKAVSVIADETRPFLQGARLTAWELQRDGIPVTLITDNMAGTLMARGEVDLVVVGADRVARNGDVANKVGTYPLAVLAHRHGIPFYVAAPTSTIDPDCASGAAIPIEERDPAEVLTVGGTRIAPEGVPARHPAFDVTPGELVTALITEAGIGRPPWEDSIPRLLGRAPEEEPAEASEEAGESETAGAEGAEA
ncbi:MAG: S-methyl-5-thioribose-1-phosphate isomerase [Acidobacteria bacterium]|nr:MAG: S-methyl-5-thioribose-1-phosphate isomerase [Acidobacteriota bacterium]